MKYTYIIFFLLITTIFANKINSDKQVIEPYSILVLGDIGQIKEFENSIAINERNINNFTKKTLTATEHIEECLSDGKSPFTMENFKIVLDHASTKISGIDETVILGDGVYTEAKNLKKVYNKLSTEPKPTVSLEDLKVEMYNRLVCGWTTVIKNIKSSTAPYIKEKTSIIFGNHSLDVDYEVELNYLMNFKTKHIAYQSEIVKDLYIEQQKSQSNVPDKTAKKVMTVDDLPFDLYYPKISWADKNGNANNNVLYIDIDMSKLICGMEADNAEIYDKCANKNFLKDYPDYNTANFMASHKNYYNQFINVMGKVNTITPKPIWKIVRLHQPIFNNEIDLNNVKLNTNIMNAFKSAGIHLWFVSHHHTAEINLSRYANKDVKYSFMNRFTNNQNREYEEVVKLDQSIQKYSTLQVVHGMINDYWYPENKNNYEPNSQSLPIPTEINRCSSLLKNCNYNNQATFYIKPDNNDYIIQCLSGNSGRKLDPLLSDLYSDSYSLYGRSFPGEFGYFVATFTGNIAEIKFYNTNQDTPRFILKVIQDDNKGVDSENFKPEVNFNKLLNRKLHYPPPKAENTASSPLPPLQAINTAITPNGSSDNNQKVKKVLKKKLS